jgi:uridine kinase
MLVTDFTKRNRPVLIGVAGGSGSGKTYFANDLSKSLGAACTTVVLQDNFYIDQSSKFDFDGGSVNFDHPDAIEFSLLAKHLRALKSGEATEIPTYDFATHKRKKETLLIKPAPVILVDGILILHIPEVRELFDETIFFDTDEALRFQRRLKRDVAERGRTPEGVHEQFHRQVKPMHDQFVQPSMSFAKHIVCNEDEYSLILAKYIERFS